MGSREVHANRSHAHHAAAAFAVVHGPRHFAAAGLQRREAGGSRSTAAEKFFLLEQPARFGVTRGDQPGILLGHQPARVRASSRTKKVRLLALQNRRDMRGEHSLGGEERHLSVVGDGAQFPIGGSVLAGSLLAVVSVDFVQVPKFTGGPKIVPHGTPTPASAEAGAYAGI